MATTLTKADGRQLAVDLLLELRALGPDVASVDSPGGQQNVLWRYLQRLRAERSEALEEGFSAILTDYMAGALDGGAPDPETYDDDWTGHG